MYIASFDVGYKNLAICACRLTEGRAEILTWDVLALVPPERKSVPSADVLSEALFTTLDALFEQWATAGWESFDAILIENQPSKGVLKTIQTLIYGYFQLQRHYHKNVKKVVLVSARDKLRPDLHPADYINWAQRAGTGNDYRKNKRQGVAVATKYIGGDATLMARFSDAKKRDDLADCLIQALAWHTKNKSQQQPILSACYVGVTVSAAGRVCPT